MSGRGKSELFSDMSSWVHHSQQQHHLHHSSLNNNNNNNNSILQANLEKHKEEAALRLSPKIDPGEDKLEPKNYTIDNHSNSD